MLGIQPQWPETGYGYVEFPQGVQPGSFETTASRVFAKSRTSGLLKNLWRKEISAGTPACFSGRRDGARTERRHLPKTATLLAGLPSFKSRSFVAKLAEVYPLCESISIDYGIMEKAASVAGFPVDDIRWNDVGSWEAVYALAAKDKDKNASRGDLVVENSRGNYVDASKTVTLVGVDDLVIVDTPDALLIAHRSKSQDVSKLVKTLEQKKREELL